MPVLRNPANNYQVEINAGPTFFLSLFFGGIYFAIIDLWGYFIASLIINGSLIYFMMKDPFFIIFLVCVHIFIASRICSARVNKYLERGYILEENEDDKPWTGGQ